MDLPQLRSTDMLARRLLLLTAVVLSMAALAAALAPRDATRPLTPGPGSALAAGEEVRATLSEPQGKVRRVRARVGDTVRLSVEVTTASFVAIDDLGVLAAVDPDAPTEIELLVDREGEFDVTLSDRKRRLGVLAVEPARRAGG